MVEAKSNLDARLCTSIWTEPGAMACVHVILLSISSFEIFSRLYLANNFNRAPGRTRPTVLRNSSRCGALIPLKP